MQATRILAIRHGETAWNVDARIQGHPDIPLKFEAALSGFPTPPRGPRQLRLPLQAAPPVR